MLLTENICPTACYFLPFRFKYSSQHPVFNHPQSMFLFQNNKLKYNSARLKNITVCRDIAPRPSISSSPRRSLLGLPNPTNGKTTGSEMTVNTYQSTRNLIPKDLNLHQHRTGKLWVSHIMRFQIAGLKIRDTKLGGCKHSPSLVFS